MASGLDQLSKLMALKSQMNAGKASAFDQQKFAQQQAEYRARQQQNEFNNQRTMEEYQQSQNALKSKGALNKLVADRVTSANTGQGFMEGPRQPNQPLDHQGMIRDILSSGKQGSMQYADDYKKLMVPKESPERPSDLSRLLNTWDAANPDASPQDRYDNAMKISTRMHDPDLASKEAGAKEAGKTLIKLQENSNQRIVDADMADYTLDQMESAASGWTQGVGANIKVIPDQIMAFFTGKSSDGLTNKDVFEMLHNKLALQARSGSDGTLAGQMSDKDVQFIKKMVLNAGNSREALMIGLKYFRQVNERQRKIASLAYEGDVSSPYAIRKRQQAWMRENPLKEVGHAGEWTSDQMTEDDWVKFYQANPGIKSGQEEDAARAMFGGG